MDLKRLQIQFEIQTGEKDKKGSKKELIKTTGWIWLSMSFARFSRGASSAGINQDSQDSDFYNHLQGLLPQGVGDSAYGWLLCYCPSWFYFTSAARDQARSRDDPDKLFGQSTSGTVLGVFYNTVAWTWYIKGGDSPPAASSDSGCGGRRGSARCFMEPQRQDPACQAPHHHG